MKNRNALRNPTTRRTLPVACAAALAVACAVSLALPAQANQIKPPPVPPNIQVPANTKAFFVGHAIGTQNYVCLPSGAGFRFVLFTPQATLFDDDYKEVTTHYFSPNPFENDTIRATWQHSRDTSTVWGKVRPADPDIPGDLGDSSSDPAFVAQGAIAWLKVTVTGAEEGPTGGDKLTKTTFIQRLNTSGGLAPSTGCAAPADVGKQQFVPYTADYFFYEKK